MEPKLILAILAPLKDKPEAEREAALAKAEDIRRLLREAEEDQKKAETAFREAKAAVTKKLRGAYDLCDHPWVTVHGDFGDTFSECRLCGRRKDLPSGNYDG